MTIFKKGGNVWGLNATYKEVIIYQESWDTEKRPYWKPVFELRLQAGFKPNEERLLAFLRHITTCEGAYNDPS